MSAPAGVQAARGAVGLALDLVALAKPRVTGLVLASTAVGLAVAPVPPAPRIVALTLLGTALVVGGANALNMYLERDVDALMERTRHRPLPAGRLAPETALVFGLALSAAALPLLTFGVNATTGLLAALALVVYVLLYTPLKGHTQAALLVGAVPGAMPPLIGHAAAAGGIELPGVVLFSIVFFWQVPHFLAIALFRRAEYARAGLVVTPNVVGERATKHHILRYLATVVLASLLLVPLGVAGALYAASAAALGAALFALGCYGLWARSTERWARGLFVASIAYLTLLFAALVADGAGV